MDVLISLQTRLVDLPPAQRFMKFDRIDWNRAFFKTYSEKRSFGHLLVNFNRIWVIHIAVYYFYTAFNSPSIYRTVGQSTPAMTWSATALGGAVATIIMILATLAEFSYIPTTWNNTSHLTRRLIFLFITLGLTAGPTFYIAIVEHNGTGGSLALILGIVQFFISVIATVLFAIIPSGRMFGDRVAGTSRKYLASQTFTASYGISSGTLFSIAHSFTLGLSIRTPWKDIYTRLLKRIYDAKLSASPDMEVKYKTRFIYLPRTCREDLFTYFLLGSRLTTLECDHDT